jgi:hypothetical protein
LLQTRVLFEESLVDQVNALPAADETPAEENLAVSGDASDPGIDSKRRSEQQPISDAGEEEEEEEEVA